MSTRHLLVPSLLAFALGFAACKSGPNPTQPAEPFAPMPIGEMAPPPNLATGNTYVETDWLLDQVFPTATGANRLKVRLVYCVDLSRALLAEQCVQANWDAACAVAQRAMANHQNVDHQSETARNRFEVDLRQQFTEALFPCTNGEPLANVSGIVWRVHDAN